MIVLEMIRGLWYNISSNTKFIIWRNYMMFIGKECIIRLDNYPYTNNYVCGLNSFF